MTNNECALDIRPSTSLQLEAVNRAVSTTRKSNSPPAITIGSIHESKNVIVGTQVVEVTQNVTVVDGVRGQVLGLEIVETKRSCRIRCSVMVCACWLMLVFVGLAVYISELTKIEQVKMELDLPAHWYQIRRTWYAKEPNSRSFLRLPVKDVIIGHSSSSYCDNPSTCRPLLLAMQDENRAKGYTDIRSNFLVSGNGYIYEGRGANVEGQLTPGHDKTSVSIMFIGDYTINETDQVQFDHINILLDILVKVNVLIGDYEVRGKCQVLTDIITPGPNVMMNMANFSPHWIDENKDRCRTYK